LRGCEFYYLILPATRKVFSREKLGLTCDSLALCEIHVAVAALVLRVVPKMTLYETSSEDVEYDYDMFIPMPKRSSKGIRVMIEA
jgi:hypothetical protein